MGGISQVLNIAKDALLTHQQSVSVAGHNIANVDTQGYSRQSLRLQTSTPSPEAAGFFGNGVKGMEISRHYDQFMVKRLVSQNATLTNLEAQEEAMRLVETSFNEAPGLAVNELMSELWATWQTLSDYPETLATREATVQQAQILIDQLHSMTREITQTRTDISVRINTAVNDINVLTRQLADINVKIASSESDLKQQNDLRDERDRLLKDLSGFMEVNYFEVGNGSYTILMADGHTLVENNESWEIDWLDDRLQWVSTASDGVQTKSPLAEGDELGGKMGGWVEIYNELVPGQAENYMGRLDALANAMIREVNQQHSQGVGLIRFAEQVTSTDAAANTALLTSTIDVATATESIPAGSITINNRDVGIIEGATAVQGVAMQKTYNAAQAINDAIAGVAAKLTTQVSGNAVTPMTPADDGSTLSFQVNGVNVSYTVDTTSGAFPGPPFDDRTDQTFAQNVVDAINAALTTYNDPVLNPGNIPKITIEAVVGDGTNGGAANSIILRNTNLGDESRIILSGAEDTALEQQLGLTDGTYVADETHNTGRLSLFATAGEINIDAGVDDQYLDQLGLGGGSISASDEGGDGQIAYTAEDGQVLASMRGYEYSDELITDGGSFKIWLYNTDADNTLAYPQAVEVSMERAYDLYDVADAINISITNATGDSVPWVYATVQNNKLVLTPDGDHQFAFGGDTSNFLATAGINTFFTGYSADSIGINSTVSDNLDYIAAGTVNEHGEIFRGDSSNSLAISNIQTYEYVRFTGSPTDTLDGFYNTLVSDIGLKGRTVSRDLEYNSLITDQLSAMKDATSGVSLDEEMADLLKFQQAYSVAAKLITTSDEMMQTLLQAV
ncbi:MAG: flagellar hook-associated protein FlgK [Desulfobulbaceae bacterium]|nr:flagellar hook-associated protein FlgK [Desulfobulbaceae bacterium]